MQKRLRFNILPFMHKATRLAGEYDANFRLDAGDGSRYLLRISHPDEQRSNVDFQNAMLAHLSASPATPFVQRLIPAKDGEMIHAIECDGRRHFVRLFSWLDGRLMAQAKPHLPGLLHSIGHMLGTADASLAGFDHAGAQRDMKWDLSRAGWIGADVDLIDDLSRRAIVQGHLSHYASAVQPRLAQLRRSVIHNDANDYNVLVSGTGYDTRAAGLIDFGDALIAPTVCNLAIALAYAMLDKPDPLASAAHMARGYHDAFPLTEAEIEMLHPLAVMRLCVSVVNSARRKREHPEDAYVVVSEAPAWRALEHCARSIRDWRITNCARHAALSRCRMRRWVPLAGGACSRSSQCCATRTRAARRLLSLISAPAASNWACPMNMTRLKHSHACSSRACRRMAPLPALAAMVSRG